MTLAELNTLDNHQLKEELTKCCGSSTWVKMMATYFPADSIEDILEEAETMWNACSEDDWKEADTHHPKIGDGESLTKKFTSTAQWASGEQSGVNTAAAETIKALRRTTACMRRNSAISLLFALLVSQQRKCCPSYRQD